LGNPGETLTSGHTGNMSASTTGAQITRAREEVIIGEEVMTRTIIGDTHTKKDHTDTGRHPGKDHEKDQGKDRGTNHEKDQEKNQGKEQKNNQQAQDKEYQSQEAQEKIRKCFRHNDDNQLKDQLLIKNKGHI